MNRKSTFLACIAMFFATTNAFSQSTDPAPYCLYKPSNAYNMWDYIKIGSQTQSFGTMGSFGSAAVYKYYNNVTFPSVAPGSNLTLEVKPYSVEDGEPIYFAVFIDYNQNNTFEASEIVMQNSNTTMAALPTFGAPASAITKTIALPSTLTAGTYRLRLVRDGFGTFTYSSTYQINPCKSAVFGYGNAYDFNLTVSSLGVDEVNSRSENIKLISSKQKEELTINHHLKNTANYSYRIYSLNGSLVEKNKFANVISINKLSASTYIFELLNEKQEQIFTGKFIKY